MSTRSWPGRPAGSGSRVPLPYGRGGGSRTILTTATLSHIVIAHKPDIPLAEGQALERPGEEDAKRIFETLHRNIYRAFDYRTESDIYDAQAQSVDGDLLDEVYREVYTSLVMRDSGGAVCRVQSVKFLDIHVDDLEESANGVGFGVASHWRVNGSVTHWGHTHFRTNE